MQRITISQELQSKCPELQLNCLECKLLVEQSNPKLREMIDVEIKNTLSGIAIDNICKLPAIEASRKAFKRLRKDPSRYRFSSEALLRRIVVGKKPYPVNNVVDILNMISFESGFSIGGYDLLKISGDIKCGIGKEFEQYHAIGRGELNIGNIPVLRDEIGPFGTPVSDSERTKVCISTIKFLMVFFNFLNQDEISPWILKAENLLKEYARAYSFYRFLIT